MEAYCSGGTHLLLGTCQAIFSGFDTPPHTGFAQSPQGLSVCCSLFVEALLPVLTPGAPDSLHRSCRSLLKPEAIRPCHLAPAVFVSRSVSPTKTQTLKDSNFVFSLLFPESLMLPGTLHITQRLVLELLLPHPPVPGAEEAGQRRAGPDPLPGSCPSFHLDSSLPHCDFWFLVPLCPEAATLLQWQPLF